MCIMSHVVAVKYIGLLSKVGLFVGSSSARNTTSWAENPQKLKGIYDEHMGGVSPQIIHQKIGFSIIFTIHFGVSLFLETPI